MADNTYTGLKVGFQIDPTNDEYLIGAELGDAFVPFARVSRNRVEELLAQAATEKKQAKSAGKPKS